MDGAAATDEVVTPGVITAGAMDGVTPLAIVAGGEITLTGAVGDFEVLGGCVGVELCTVPVTGVLTGPELVVLGVLDVVVVVLGVLVTPGGGGVGAGGHTAAARADGITPPGTAPPVTVFPPPVTVPPPQPGGGGGAPGAGLAPTSAPIRAPAHSATRTRLKILFILRPIVL
jgi:hypothetical protein